jgi:hypothetical protein
MIQNQLSNKSEVPISVRASLIALSDTVTMHERNKARLQDKLANLPSSENDCREQYKTLLSKTISMIDHLNKQIHQLIKLL